MAPDPVDFRVSALSMWESGPFTDFIGRFQGLADRERVFVLLNLMERQVKVSLPVEVFATA